MLFRFDGFRFELFRSPFGDQLQSINVSGLFGPATGGLWVGYVFGGFSFVKNGRVTNFAERTGTVFGFAQNTNAILWAATYSGLWRFDGSSWQPIGAEWGLVPKEPAIQVGLDREGILWVLARSRDPKIPKKLYFLPPGEKQFRKAETIFSLIAFHGMPITLSLRRRSSEPGSGIELESSLPAYPILRKESEQILDRANSIWFLPAAPFVFRHPAGEPLAEIISNASPGNSERYDIDPQRHANLVDREGGIWIADQPGIHRFSYSHLIEQELPKQPGPHVVLAPDEDGVMWISAGNGVGSSALNRVTGGKVESQGRQGGMSNFAYRPPDKTFWFGGEAELWHMVNGRLTKIELPQEMTERARDLASITQDRSGGMWVSFGGAGLYRLKDGVWTKYEARRDLSPHAARSVDIAVEGVTTRFGNNLG